MSEALTSAPGALEKPGPQTAAVFLAYRFSSKEDWVRHYVLSILNRWGYTPEEGSHFDGLPIAGAVRAAIGKAQGMVAFVTKDRKLAQEGWAASDWVLEEIGFASGRGIPVIVIVERGVSVNLGILSDIQRIDLDPKAPYHALIRLRLALQSVLPVRDPNQIRIEHIARPSTKISSKQWWDFWTWVDAPSQTLSQIKTVSYYFPPSFTPRVEVENNRGYGFGNYGETNEAFLLRVSIEFENGRRQKLSHRVTFFE